MTLLSHLSRHRLLVSLVSVFALLGVAGASSPPRSDVPPELRSRSNPESLDEKEVRYYTRQFKAKCARCHGIEGNGGGDEAGAQTLPPADFTDAAFMKSRTDGELFYQILVGGGSRSAMPAFGPGSDISWSEEKIWHMVAFIRRFAKPDR